MSGTAIDGMSQEGPGHHQQSRGPIPLPIEVLTEVLSFIPRPQRASLALVSGLVAQIVVSTVSDERQKILTTAPGLCDSLSMQVKELTMRLDELNDQLEAIYEWCEAEKTRVAAFEPPLLVQQTSPLDRVGRRLKRRTQDHDIRNGKRGRRVEEIGKELDELVVQLQDAEEGGDEWEGLGLAAALAERLARSAHLTAKQFDSDIAIRRLESQLWQRGLRPKHHTTRYQAAWRRDPHHTVLIEAYTQLGARYKQKREVALEMAALQRQAQTIVGRLERVEGEYKRIGYEEEL